MSLSLFQAVSLTIAGVSVVISYIKYREYKYEKQRDIYQSIVGNEYEFEITGEDETNCFEVVNIDVKSGRRPWKWHTLVVIEFDIEEFPWDSRDDDVANDAAKDLAWTFNLLTKETPEIRGAELFESYKAPALTVVFPSTDLFAITDFLRKTQTTIGHVFWHYESDEMAEMPMRLHAHYLEEHLELLLQNTDSDREDSMTTPVSWVENIMRHHTI
ncbi:hypothetical protein [Natronosalvus amylolyticus]|uniref:hypothetical protein n=1 Tax=Natronosalvus amylolyticus TaxID=2961994 RepID=UPI0020CA0EAD|nr:hypothetical protein [Natronosalvus amylolyticus]